MGNLMYQNWLVELIRPRRGLAEPPRPPEPPNPRVRGAVRQALKQLDIDERLVIEWVYFLGQTFRELSELTGRPMHRLETIQRRAFRKLRTMLRPFVAAEFGLTTSSRRRRCVVCESDERGQIESLIVSRDRTATWRPVLKAIREQCRTAIRSPLILSTHERYHMLGEIELRHESDRTNGFAPTNKRREGRHDKDE